MIGSVWTRYRRMVRSHNIRHRHLKLTLGWEDGRGGWKLGWLLNPSKSEERTKRVAIIDDGRSHWPAGKYTALNMGPG